MYNYNLKKKRISCNTYEESQLFLKRINTFSKRIDTFFKKN